MPRPKKQVLKQRKDGRYCCKYHGIQFFGATSDEALAAREEYKRREQDGSACRAQGPCVQEYAKEWLRREKSHVADHTYTECICLLEKLTKRIGTLYFRDVKPSDIRAVYAGEFVGLSNSYIRKGAQLYRALFTAALEDGYCVSNPVDAKSARPPVGKESVGHRAVTKQERTWIETFCLDHRARPAIMAMLYAGLRPQEAKALNIDRDVDFKAGVIHVRQSVHFSGNNHYTVTDELKTKQSRRTVPILPPLRKALQGRHGLLIAGADGKPVTVQAWDRVWESYVHCMETEINGCPERWYGRRKGDRERKLPPFKRFTVVPYDLRHSFCTMCRDNGIEINTCIHWMGHKDATMILRIYDEYSPERGRKEAKKLEKLLNGMQNGMQTEQTPSNH